MSDTLGTVWQALEDKMMMLIAEKEQMQIDKEQLQAEREQLHKENVTLKFEREEHAKRLHGLISLIDSVNKVEVNMSANAFTGQVKPMLVQG